MQHHKRSRVCILTNLFNFRLEFILKITLFLDELLFDLVSLIYSFFICVWFIQIVLKFSKLTESLLYCGYFHIFRILLPVVRIINLNIEPINFIKPKIRSRINHIGSHAKLPINFWRLIIWIFIFQLRIFLPFIINLINLLTESILLRQVVFWP